MLMRVGETNATACIEKGQVITRVAVQKSDVHINKQHAKGHPD